MGVFFVVSVIMPNYNGARFIAQTIEAVLAQSFADLELIIADDCSCDESAAIISAYAAKDARVSLLRLAKNSGVSAARNAAIAKAKGDFLAFCDSDDIWLPNKLEDQLEFMKKGSYAFSFTEFQMIDEQNKVIKERVSCPAVVDYERLITGNPIMCSSALINVKRTGKFTVPDFALAQDYATWAGLMKAKKIKAYCTGTVLAQYRKGRESLSADKARAFKYTWRINKSFLKLSLAKNIYVNFIYIFRWVKKHYF
jgi:teichuronic acid biosynthesis glycosyltransferase TuaG